MSRNFKLMGKGYEEKGSRVEPMIHGQEQRSTATSRRGEQVSALSNTTCFANTDTTTSAAGSSHRGSPEENRESIEKGQSVSAGFKIAAY